MGSGVGRMREDAKAVGPSSGSRAGGGHHAFAPEALRSGLESGRSPKAGCRCEEARLRDGEEIAGSQFGKSARSSAESVSSPRGGHEEMNLPISHSYIGVTYCSSSLAARLPCCGQPALANRSSSTNTAPTIRRCCGKMNLPGAAEHDHRSAVQLSASPRIRARSLRSES